MVENFIFFIFLVIEKKEIHQILVEEKEKIWLVSIPSMKKNNNSGATDFADNRSSTKFFIALILPEIVDSCSGRH